MEPAEPAGPWSDCAASGLGDPSSVASAFTTYNDPSSEITQVELPCRTQLEAGGGDPAEGAWLSDLVPEGS